MQFYSKFWSCSKGNLNLKRFDFYQYLLLWNFLSSRRKLQFFMLLFVMLLSSACEAVTVGSLVPFLTLLTSDSSTQPQIIKYTLDIIQFNSVQASAYFVTVFFCIMSIGTGILRFCLVMFSSRYSQCIGCDIGSEIYAMSLHQTYESYISRNSAQIISAISSKVDGVVHHVVMPILIILSSILIASAVIGGLFVIDKTMSFALIFIISLIYISVALLTRNRLLRYGNIVSLQQTQIVKCIQEGLGGIRNILVDGTQSVFCKQFDDSNRMLRRSSANIQTLASTPRFIVESVVATIMAISAYLALENDLYLVGVIPVLGAFVFGFQRVLPLLQQVYSSWSSMRGSQGVLRDVLHLINENKHSLVDSNAQKINFSQRIELKDVWYRYPKSSDWALKGISMVIPKGSVIGVFGKTGSGKSTLIDVFMGLLMPTKGCMEVDGIKITSSNRLTSWFPHVSHVPQDIYLSDSSVAANVAFGVESSDINIPKVRSVSAIACANDFIEKLPDQYVTQIGERGMRLSGGQRQRIGIARALYKSSDVLILDEATSALDSQTEQEIIESILNFDRSITVIMVAHRLTTLANCDFVVELDDGFLKNIGSYNDLILTKREPE